MGSYKGGIRQGKEITWWDLLGFDLCFQNPLSLLYKWVIIIIIIIIINLLYKWLFAKPLLYHLFLSLFFFFPWLIVLRHSLEGS
ncbi:MAG: hypothetical protein N7Q72_02490, partial [Spiroplasma sp. Tabriz.8]|nr:hypothetical protein [Spiroplasma sp. Tabriz.8]